MARRSLSLVLPWPPSLNRIWRVVARRIVLSAAARQYAKTCANALPRGQVEPLTGRLTVSVLLHPPVKLARKPLDICNREKVLFDTLTKQRIWLDDSQIDLALFVRGEPRGEGSVELLIVED